MYKDLPMLLRKWGQGIVEELVFFPILLLIAIMIVPLHYIWVWLGSLLFLFLMGLLLRKYLNGKRRGFYLLIIFLINGLVSLLVMPHTWLTLPTFLIGLVVTYRGIIYIEKEWEEVFPLVFLWISLPIYFVAYLVYRYIERFSPYLSLITWAGSLCLIVTLFVTNHRHLETATLSDSKKPILSRTLKRQNRVFIVITLIVLFLIASFHWIAFLFSQIVSYIVSGVAWFFSLFSHDRPPEKPLTPSTPQFPQMEQQKPSAWAEIFEKVLMIGVYILIIAAILFLLYWLYKNTRKWFSKLYARLVRFLNKLFHTSSFEHETAAFIDEKESLIEDWRKASQHKIKQWFTRFKREPGWEDLKTNQERVRYLYTKTVLNEIKKGYQYKPSLTAHETLKEIGRDKSYLEPKEELLDKMYNQTRYSPLTIDDREIKKFIDKRNKENGK
ncbi:MFS family permease [Pullulanibacillus pueri]|uniref:DUF4129 domain-containing protein n=1 Tax=Pullulanibacillus pueri TaxID=1437324 RepID=A0A8J2ZT10_9BACL|nr:hypothetical protein [Pullulanibacillus pueri]MBM7681040.1 MFS family permease [Pullulanibacillus pueri]GGH76809.1 hypothetical protein GCM10007096_07770 [Pullulanibacillus pueri]